MAAKYLWSGATGGGTGADYTNAYTTLTAAIAGIAAGDTLYVADDHSESVAASTTWAFPGTWSNPNYFLCTNRTTALLSTGATISSSGTTVNLELGGSLYSYGIKLQSSNGAFNSALNFGLTSGNCWQYHKNFYLDHRATGTNAYIQLGSTGNNAPTHIVFDTPTFAMVSNNNNFRPYRGALVEIINPTFSGTTFASPLIKGTATYNQHALFRVLDGDLSPLGSNPLVDVSTVLNDVVFANLKLGASYVLTTGTPAQDNSIMALNCDSGDTNNLYQLSLYGSAVKTDTGVYLTTGGSATTHNGASVPQSLKVTPSSNASRLRPIYTPWQPVFNDTTGSRTISIKVAYDGGAVPTILKDYELFLEVEYLGTTGFPQGSIATTSPDIINSGTALTDTAAAWTGTAGWTAKKTHTLSKAVTVQEQGAMRWRVGVVYNANVASIYVDNKAGLA